MHSPSWVQVLWVLCSAVIWQTWWALRLRYRFAEGAGAAATAALVQEREQQAGKRVAVILTGGNIDIEMFNQVLSGGTPNI